LLIGRETGQMLSSSYRANTLQGEEKRMKHLSHIIWKIRIFKDTRGQDLIEYALMAGFVAVAAGAVMPGVSSSISTIFSKVKSALESGAGQGS
jgi:pilus assembly protein Flp/PilA